LRIEAEKKALKKQREKERKERLRAEGKLLTPKQRMQQARAQAMLEALKAQGVDVPEVGEKKAPRPGTRIRPSKLKKQASSETSKLGDIIYCVNVQCLSKSAVSASCDNLLLNLSFPFAYPNLT